MTRPVGRRSWPLGDFLRSLHLVLGPRRGRFREMSDVACRRLTIPSRHVDGRGVQKVVRCKGRKEEGGSRVIAGISDRWVKVAGQVGERSAL
jgi:hypothetical protein